MGCIYYTRVVDNSVPKRIGAYVITHTPDNIHAEKYVGSTVDLYKRINNKKFGHRFYKNIIYIDLYITDEYSLAQSLERILIELLRPATNYRRPHLCDKDLELMNELMEDERIQMSYNIIKVGYRYLKYVIGEDIRKRIVNGRIVQI